MKILFWLNTSKKNKHNEHPLYCRLTIAGERAEISTGVSLKKQDFDNKKKRIKSSEPMAQVYNKMLTSLSHKLSELYYAQIFNGDTPSAQDIKKRHLDQGKNKINVLALIVDEYISAKHDVVRNLTVYKRNVRFLELLKSYLKRRNAEKIKIGACDYYFYEDFSRYLRNEKHFSGGYIKKNIELLKSSGKYAYNQGYTNKLPVDFALPFKDSKEIIYLNEREIGKISKHKFAEPHLQRIADCFMVQCYTGLAYVDLRRLSSTNIVLEKDGLWININRQKVATATSTIPVLKNVKELLLKYNFNLPVISNQKYNSGLKQIAREVGIHKKITSHVGRKTFGTLLLNKDVPIETVSKLLGHSTVGMTQKYYAKVLHMKIAKDLRLIM